MRSYAHSVSFIDIQESIDSNLTIPIMEGWQLDFAGRATIYGDEDVFKIEQDISLANVLVILPV